jgi:hypothetical protein
MSDVRNQLQTLTGGEIVASQLSTVGGKIFTNATSSQVDVKDLTGWWRSVHVPTYGQPIPGSSFAVSVVGDVAVYAPGTNEAAQITGLTITNNNATTPAEIQLLIGTQFVHQSAPIPPGEIAIVIGIGQNPLSIVDGQTLSIQVAGVPPPDVTSEASGFLVVQG